MIKRVKEPVRLRRKPLANGNFSLYLAVNLNGRRTYEFLKLYLIPESGRAERERNRNTLALAEAIKARRILEIQQGLHGFASAARRVNFFDYMDKLMRQRIKRDSSATGNTWRAAIGHLATYARNPALTFADITPGWIEGFRDYLEREAIGARGAGTQFLSPNTARAYFTKLRTALRQAHSEGIIPAVPSGIKAPALEEPVRAYLTIEELRLLTAARCDSALLRRAFLFSCLTGLRRSDVERLTWGEVSTLNGRIRLIFRQKKTGGQEYLDLTAQAAELLGERGTSSPDAAIFPGLPCPAATNEALRLWALRAGIDKHITFHCGRHTFAVMMLTIGTDLYTVSKLLGHRDIKTTQIYARIVDAKKQEAVDNIPQIL